MVFLFRELCVCTSAQELEELYVFHLIVKLLLSRFGDDVHFAHTVAIGDFVLVRDDLVRLSHQLDTVCLVHVLLSRSEVRSVDLVEMPLVHVQDLVRLIAPPYIISELLPLLGRTKCEAVLVEEHLEGISIRSGQARLEVL